MRPRSLSPGISRRALATMLTAGLLVAVGPGIGVDAAPTSDEVRGDLSRAQDRLDQIDEQLSLAVEEFNLAAVALEEAEDRLGATQDELDKLLVLQADLDAVVEEHLRRIYKLGPALELSTVVIASHPSEAGVKSWTLRRIFAEQRADLEALEANHAVVEATRLRAEAERRQARAVAAAHEQARISVEAAFAVSEDEVAELNVLLEDTIAEERRRAEEARRRAEAERAARQAAAEAAERRAREAAVRTAAPAPRTTAISGATPNPSASAPAPGPAPAPAPAPPPTPAPAPAPAPSTRQSADVAVQTALAQLGKPYKWGGSGPNSYDCSGLTSYAWRAAGVTIPRTSRTQYSGTKRITREQLQPGDLVFYHSPISHVAMYIGNGQVVEAPNSGNQVRIRSDGLTRRGIVGYGRV